MPTLTMQTLTIQTTECIEVPGLEFAIFSLKKTKSEKTETQQR